MSRSLTFHKLVTQHAARCKRWHKDPAEGRAKIVDVLRRCRAGVRKPAAEAVDEIYRVVREYEPWSPLEWVGAAAGELGEAANMAKKLKRLQQGLANPDGRDTTPTREKYVRGILRELADTIHYCVLTANEIDPNGGALLEEELINTFNEKSDANGFPERLLKSTYATTDDEEEDDERDHFCRCDGTAFCEQCKQPCHCGGD